METRFDLEGHPKVGASWEGFGLTEIVARLGARREECYFWATHGGAEIDLLVVRGRRRLGFEFKYTDAPSMTRSMHSALADLRLDRLDVVHAGQHTYPLAENVRALALSQVCEKLEPLA
jgi:predicted AAA+ superfamily ATPase